MALKKGVCKNFENCTLADNQELQEVDSSEFRCTECGKPLSEPDSKPPKHFPQWAKIIVAVVALAGLITGGFFLFKSCDSKVRITVLSSDETMGTVKGGGKYEFNKIITIEANANEGYRFVSWDDNNTKNPREILTKEDGTYTALFERIPMRKDPPTTPLTITITVKPLDENMGTVSGGGTFGLGETISIGAIAKDGFKFVSWDDENKDNPREVITRRDETFVAVFEKIQEAKPDPKLSPDSKLVQINWRGVATYDGYVKNGQPDGVGGKLTFYRKYQLDLKDVEGTKLDIKAGETIENTKFENGNLRQGELHRNDGSRKWFNI